MSTLTTSLIILVGVALLAVVLYNWRQGSSASSRGTRDGAKKSDMSGKHRRGDVDPLLEPATLPQESLEADKSVGVHPDSPTPQAVGAAASGGTTGSQGARMDPGSVGSAPTKPVSIIDERLDAIVHIPLNEAVPGDRLIALTAGFRRAGTKTVTVEAAGQHGWQALVSNASFDALRLGVLMSNRHGPLNGVEYSEFVNALQPLGEHLEVMIDTPNLTEVVQHARDLDAVCAQLDAQVGLNVDAASAFSPAQLEAFAREYQLVEKGNTRYACVAVSGETLFNVVLSNQANRINFLLDVPRVAERLMPWAKMVDCANACAQFLNGQVVDDDGRVLGNDALRQIGEQLGERYQALAQAGFEAGSASAARVFV